MYEAIGETASWSSDNGRWQGPQPLDEGVGGDGEYGVGQAISMLKQQKRFSSFGLRWALHRCH
jgi:hypothetical protein